MGWGGGGSLNLENRLIRYGLEATFDGVGWVLFELSHTRCAPTKKEREWSEGGVSWGRVWRNVGRGGGGGRGKCGTVHNVLVSVAQFIMY